MDHTLTLQDLVHKVAAPNLLLLVWMVPSTVRFVVRLLAGGRYSCACCHYGGSFSHRNCCIADPTTSPATRPSRSPPPPEAAGLAPVGQSVPCWCFDVFRPNQLNHCLRSWTTVDVVVDTPIRSSSKSPRCSGCGKSWRAIPTPCTR